MITDSKHRWFQLCPIQDAHQSPFQRSISPYLVESWQQPGKAGDGIDLDRFELGLPHLSFKLVRVMKEGGREVFRPVRGVPVLAVSEILPDNFHEFWISDESSERAVEG